MRALGVHVCNNGTTLWNTGEERKEKKMIVNSIKIPCVCADRKYDMY
jgi:hypothetical protein